MSFKHRSYEKELLDQQTIPFADIQRNMRELNVINKYLGGHKTTIAGIKNLTSASTQTMHIAEIGCGDGNNLRVIKQWCQQNRIDAQLTGIDINKECIRFAEEQSSNSGIRFICSDYSSVSFEPTPDIVFSSLFCHHFKEDELFFMMQWMYRNSRVGFFINDLHRHALAYHSIRLMTRLFSKSYLVKNDAPLSVKRGFVRSEWNEILKGASISSYNIKWKWAFRWLIFCHK